MQGVSVNEELFNEYGFSFARWGGKSSEDWVYNNECTYH